MEELLKQLGVSEQELMANPSKKSSTFLTPVTSAILLTPVAISSMLVGFFGSLALAKRKNAKDFEKGLATAFSGQESGASLATKAFARGSLYAIGGSALIASVLYLTCPESFKKPKTSSN